MATTSDTADAENHDQQKGRGVKGWFAKLSTTGKVITAIVGALAALTGPAVTLIPGIVPCSGTHGATLVAAVALPDYTYDQFQVDLGKSPKQAATYQNTPGIEVRYRYQASNLDGQPLEVMTTLVRVRPDGTLGATYYGKNNLGPVDLLRSDTVTPHDCVSAVGQTMFVPLLGPPPPRGRYKLLLEVFRGTAKTVTARSTRVAIGSTQEFDL